MGYLGGQGGGETIEPSKPASLDWILSGSASNSSDVSSHVPSEHDVYVLCLQGHLQEKSVGEDAIDFSNPDGEISAQLLSLLGPQFVIAASVIGTSSSIIVACHSQLMAHVTNIELFEGSSSVQDSQESGAKFVACGEACAVSMCIAEASFLFLNWPAVVRPPPAAGGLSLSLIDAMVTLYS